MKHNPKNDRIRRSYLVFLKEAKRHSESTVDAVASAISRFETYAKWRDFKAFHFQQAVGFKAHLAKQINENTGKPLSQSTLNSTLRHVKDFFQWLSMQPGYKSTVSYHDAEYFNLSEKDVRIATAKRTKRVPTIEQIKHVISVMPHATDIEKRNRSVLAFTLLTGARDKAIASFKIKHVDFISNQVMQDARDVNTKYSKTFNTCFFTVGDDIRLIVVDWVEHLKKILLYGGDDPLFPKTKVAQSDERRLQAVGLINQHWSNASPIRTIFREAFESAGLPYFNPHSVRDTLVGLGEQVCKSPEEFKAWSQNLGHAGVLTTFCSYGEVQPRRQIEIFSRLGSADDDSLSDLDDLLDAVRQRARRG